MNSQQILDAMERIDDAYILSARERLYPTARHTSSKRPLRRLTAGLAAAILLLAASFATALAVSGDFRGMVWEFFHIGPPEIIPEQTAPSGDYPSAGIPTEESMAVQPEKIYIGDVIEGTYLHTPTASHASNGVFFICTDEVMMNSGNHYDAYVERDGELVKLQEHTFRQDYSILGNDFHVEFEWVEAGGTCHYTYIDAHAPWRKPGLSGPLDATLFTFPLTLTGTDGSVYNTTYPVLINLYTGELTDFLAGTGVSGIPDLYQAAISEDRTKLLLVTWEGELYYVDIPAKMLYSVTELSGEPADSCCLTDTTLTCWTLEGDSMDEAALGSYNIWSIDLQTLERTDLFDSIPATSATSHDVWSNTYQIALESPELWKAWGGKDLESPGTAGLHFISGFDHSSHAGNMYSGSKFAIEVDSGRNVYVIDLSDGQKSVIYGFLWPEVDYPQIECVPSPDGNKLLISCRTEMTYYEYIGVLDFAQGTYFEFSRENLDNVNEHTIYWFGNDAILIRTSHQEGITESYIYRLLQ